jgi:hypothetical protein
MAELLFATVALVGLAAFIVFAAFSTAAFVAAWAAKRAQGAINEGDSIASSGTVQ